MITKVKRIQINKNVLARTRIAIVRSNYNEEFTRKLENACVETLIQYGVLPKKILITVVPGSLEIPIAAQRIAIAKKADVVIALGVVLKGATYHFELVSNECARGCMEVSLTYNIPLIFEVICALNLKQVKERTSGVNNKGREAAISALKIIEALGRIK